MAKKKMKNKQNEKDVICPLDGKPCEKGCPDRYEDQPEGGCTLTTAVELGGQALRLNDGSTAILFTPKGGQA